MNFLKIFDEWLMFGRLTPSAYVHRYAVKRAAKENPQNDSHMCDSFQWDVCGRYTIHHLKHQGGTTTIVTHVTARPLTIEELDAGIDTINVIIHTINGRESISINDVTYRKWRYLHRCRKFLAFYLFGEFKNEQKEY